MSKVVDENGEPLVVYHGTTKGGFTQFATARDAHIQQQTQAPEGSHWFVNDRDKARSYSGKDADVRFEGDEWQRAIYPVFLNIRNPRIEDFEGEYWNDRPQGGTTNDVATKAQEDGNDGLIVYNVVDEGGYSTWQDMEDNDTLPMNAEGATDYVVFSPNQIKSATDNVGTFDASNDDIRRREGSGALSDDALSAANDPMSRVEGGPRRTSARRRAFAERERMVERVRELAEKLHLDNVEIVTDASQLEGRRAKAKGFYSKSTGKITIVIPNHASVSDAVQTLLHEAVAHYGLRQLFGERFDTFLDNVFSEADKDVRRRIVEMARRRGWDFRTATEEYLASLAESTDFENMNASWWGKIKQLFLDMLDSLGLMSFMGGVKLSDNELRYILWRSYENLAEPGRYRNVFAEAKDIAKQHELKVGNYAPAAGSAAGVAEAANEPTSEEVLEQAKLSEDEDALFRDGGPETHERKNARDIYDRRVRSGMYQTQEALQDSMLGLKEAIQAVLGKETNIEDVRGFENAYLGESRLSSVSVAM